jgi:1-acyl-sn-glycerol-3-phosphate acyltransferase
MKILPNLTSIIKAYYALRYLTAHKKEIERARATGDIEAEKAGILAATTTWGSKLAALFGAKITVYGKENLPKEGPVLYVSNHQAAADIVVLCAALDSIQYSFITKAELAKVPLYGKWIDRVRAIFLERDDPRSSLQSIKNGIEYLQMGFSLLIFPEGTRSRGIKMGEFKPGAFKLATKPGVPIVPVTINGTYRTYEDTGIMTGAPVQVMVHPAIPTKGLTREQERDLPDQVKAVIQAGLDKLVALENESPDA